MKPMPQENLLLISCYFPPAGGVGVQRAVSLARYLPQNGFRVFVLTARASVPTVDAGLMNLIPDTVQVHRTWTLEPPFHLRKTLWSRVNSPASASSKTRNGFAATSKSIVSRKIKQIICPDPQVLWYPFAIRRATKLIREQGIQTVLVTAPPFSSFLIANELKRRFPHLRAIADMRDEWLQYFAKEFVFRDDKYVAARAAQIERATVESCDRMVSVTAASRSELRSRYPEQPDEKFVLVPNGYDPADFAEFHSRPHNTGKLVVSYIGTIYRPCSPKFYLDALDGLPQIRSDFETRIVGRITEEFDRGVFENRQSVLRLSEFVPHKDAVRFMEESDVLLLPWTDRFNIPGKTFEYLMTGKPILALCYPDSEVARVIKQTASGWCVNPDDKTEIQRALTEIHALGGKYPQERNWKAIRGYERPRLAAEYAQVIRDASRPIEERSFEQRCLRAEPIHPSLI
jgi:glycosyl transferase family 4/glycosyl transferase family 1